jgi:hypothetical protein
MIKVLFLGEANLELSKAVDYYEEIHSGLGLDFEREVKENVFKIAGLFFRQVVVTLNILFPV